MPKVLNHIMETPDPMTPAYCVETTDDDWLARRKVAAYRNKAVEGWPKYSIVTEVQRDG